MAALTESTAPASNAKSILVAIDFAQLSKTLVIYASALARIHSAQLYLMHVVPSDELQVRHRDDAVQDAWSKMHEIDQARIESGYVDENPYYMVVREGDVWQQLRDVIDRQAIDLVLLGARNQWSTHTSSLGTVAEQVFRYANCDVMTFGQLVALQADRRRKVVFPTDLSDASLAALPQAIAIANRQLAQLVLVRVPGSDLRNRTTFLDKVAQIVTKYVPAVKPDGYEIFADPVDAILQVAADTRATGIIMSCEWGCRSANVAKSWWSTIYQVACRATCPVLSIRCPQRVLSY